MKIGAGDDITGILLKRIIELNKAEQGGKLLSVEENLDEEDLEFYTFKDCCSNTAQWALTAKEIDMAFYCNHMALHLVRANEDFVIYGPVIMNAEVIAYKDELSEVERLGIGQKKEHLHRLAEKSHNQIKEIIEMSPSSLPYSLEGGLIDGAVLDTTKAALLPAFNFVPFSEDDYISYCLVVRKDIIETEEFKGFLDSYNKAVDEFNQEEVLQNLINGNKALWDSINIKFLNLE
ncbi:hypothetical protein E9840_06240 [Tissierella creatinini]|nr:hypothetical protein E9840_06240 [Tissierella creatinini]TJX63752.1 hypothetical protein E8P77_14385 [Soehngenia saccharolytica]